MSTPTPPDRVAGHRILKMLGEGGSGAVYLAAPDDDPTRRVALKILRPGMTFSEQERRRFQREGEIGFSLDHPNILPARAVGVLDGSWVMTFEAIDGYTLAEAVGAGFRAPHEAGAAQWTLVERLNLLADVADGLAHAHARGVVHRDVKSRNVMIRRVDRHPFVIDFGLARDLRADSSLTKSGAVFGTPTYMAPEQLDGDIRRVGPPSDVYALGVMIHELVSGEPPFKNASFEAQRRAVADDEPPRLRSLVPDTPVGLEALVLETLEKRPELRPRAGAVRDALRRLAGGGETGASRVVHLRRAGRRVRRARFGLVAGAALILGAAALALFQLSRRQAGDLEQLEIRALFDQASIDLANGELDAALVPLGDAIARRPDDPVGYLELAAAHESFGQHEEMRRALTAATERGFDPARVDPASPRGLQHLGLSHMAAGRWEPAAEALSAAVARDDGSGASYLALVKCYRLLRREAEAQATLREFRDTLAARSKSFPFIEAQLLELGGSLESAWQALEEIDSTSLDEASRNRRDRGLGRLLVKLKRYDEAFAVLTALVERESGDGAAWLQRGIAQLKLGRIEAALDDARRGARLAPAHAAAEVLLIGIAWLVRNSDDARARRILSEAGVLENVDDLFDAQREYEIARVRWNDGDPVTARGHLDRALAKDPELAPALVLRANDDWYAGRLHEAFLGFDAAQRAYLLIDGVESGIATWRRQQNTSYRDLRGAIHVGRFAVGTLIGELDAARDSEGAVRVMLTRGEDVEVENRLNFAEALARRASAKDGDCVLARRIVSAPGFRDELREEVGEDQAIDTILAEISKRCP